MRGICLIKQHCDLASQNIFQLWFKLCNKLKNLYLTLDVTLDNVFIGQRVKQGRHWRSKWRDNIEKTSTTIPKKRVIGTIIGYIKDGIIIGKNTTRKYNTLDDECL